MATSMRSSFSPHGKYMDCNTLGATTPMLIPAQHPPTFPQGVNSSSKPNHTAWPSLRCSGQPHAPALSTPFPHIYRAPKMYQGGSTTCLQVPAFNRRRAGARLGNKLLIFSSPLACSLAGESACHTCIC